MAVKRLSIFPLGGVILFPGLQLPLHIFEPRYRAMISDSLPRDRLIGMVQPRVGDAADTGTAPVFETGCLGRIADIEALDDGRFNVVLEGVSLFRIVRELDVTTPFRQVEAELLPENEADQTLSAVERAALEREAKRFAVWLGYRIDWDGVARLDDATFVNAMAQVSPFDAASKQALLEAPSLGERAELLMQLVRFACSGRDPGESHATLQ